MNKLLEIKSSPIILDACILMVGIKCQNVDPDYSFENMRTSHLKPLFDYAQDIKIHEEVMNELDEQRKQFINQYIGKNVEIVSEGCIYGVDPIYTTLFNSIAKHELFKYSRGSSNNKGEIYSLAYAAYNNIPFISSRDGSVIRVVNEMQELSNIDILGFEYVLSLGYLFNEKSKELNKRLNSLYKSQCGPSVRSGLIPETFSLFLESLK